MITAIALKDGTLWVGAEGRDHRGLPVHGSACCPLPSWANHQAMLAMIGAAMDEAEAHVRSQIAYASQNPV